MSEIRQYVLVDSDDNVHEPSDGGFRMKVYQIYDQHTDAYTAWAANDEADAIAQYIAENPPDLTVEQVWPAEQVRPVYCEGDDTAKYPLEDWRQEVVNGDTQLGYAEWLAQRLSAHWWGL